MNAATPFKWRHFEAEIILLCVRLLSDNHSCRRIASGKNRFSARLILLVNLNKCLKQRSGRYVCEQVAVLRTKPEPAPS